MHHTTTDVVEHREHTTHRAQRGRRSVGRTFLVLIVATVTMATLGATRAAGAATPLTRAASALSHSAGSRTAAPAVAPRIAGLPNITKVTTASGSLADSSTEVATSANVTANLSGDQLVVSWGGTNTLSVTGSGPLTPGTTVSTPGAVVVTGSLACGSTAGSVAVASIDQIITVGGNATTLALQFGCVSLEQGSAVFGTVGINVPPTTRVPGYNLFEGNGTVTSFGTNSVLSGGIFGVDVFGDASAIPLNRPVVGMATTPLDGGYWLVAGDGGVFSFGDAKFYGSTGNLRLNKPVLGMAATPDGKGYWFVASDGGIFSYGDAKFYGSTGNLHLNKPIVGMATTPDGKGYWLVASDGGIFSFGDAKFYGSTGNLHLNKPIVGMAATADGQGYWLVASDGGIFTFGDATFHGSAGAIHLNSPIVGMSATPDDGGYWLAASDGGVFTFGDATFAGSLGDQGVNDVAGVTP